MPRLVKQGKKAQKAQRKSDLWIAPVNSFKRTSPQADWKLKRVELAQSSKFLELADIALGVGTAEKRKRKTAA